MNNIYLSIFLLVLIVLIITLYKINSYKEKKAEELELSRFNGWHYIKLENLKQNKGVIKALNIIKANSDESVWRDEFIKTYFNQIYFRDNFTLFALIKAMHEDTSLSVESKKLIKRKITASSVLFNFRLPASLWLFDQYTLEIILKYAMLCDTVKLNINAYTSAEFTSSKIDKQYFLNNIVGNLNYSFNYIIKSGHNNRAPNLIHLFDLVSKSNPKLYASLNKDFNNFKILMTLSYALLNLDIPKDYLNLDQNIYSYLVSPEIFTKSQKKHLVSVK